MPTIIITNESSVIYKTKVCKKCEIERDRDLFNKKGKPHYPESRVSTCRICQSKNGVVYSFYSFPTKEMNNIANKNRNRISLRLKTAKNTIYKKTIRQKICPRCNQDIVSYNNIICASCRRKGTLINRKRIEKSKIIRLSNSYIKNQIKHSLKDYKISKKDVPQDLIELKRKQLLLTRQIKNHESKKENINN